MTLDEFFNDLSLSRGQWELCEDDCIRHREAETCPLAFVANSNFETDFDSERGYEAGVSLGLEDDEIHDIIFAADNHTDLCETEETYNIRGRLLKAIGLEENWQ